MRHTRGEFDADFTIQFTALSLSVSVCYYRVILTQWSQPAVSKMFNSHCTCSTLMSIYSITSKHPAFQIQEQKLYYKEK